MVYGRSAELTILENDYRKNNSSIVTLYGRRRIGKSSLVAFYVKDKSSFCFEAIEGQNTKEQISHFINQLKTQYKDELFESLRFENWDQVFKYLSSILAKRSQEKKTVIYFDELQWMAAGQSKLIGLLKYFWDNSWKKYNIQLILCGSIASFMLEKVIHSKALYGRIDIELQIKELNLASLSKIKKNKISKKDCLLYNMIFGGIPKYFELIKPEFPVAHNIQALCFSEEGYLFNEYRKIFYSQFKEYLLYEKIISYLLKYPHSLKEISLKLKIASGGGLKRYLDILEKSRFVRSYSSVLKGGGKEIKYKVFDEYLIFYLKYIKPSQKILSKISDKNYFKSHIESQWRPWLGIAFENYCLKNIENIINRLEILDEVIDVGPYFEKNTDSFQIDILIKVKNGDAYLCECKYRDEKITSEVIVEVERKRNLIENKISGKIKPILIAPNGASNELVSSEYFYQILTLNDLWLD
jgi:AAA+ ATPase superfamily predicted ATPase